MAAPVYTVGHSNRTSSEFVALLVEAGIGELVDVRTHPGSRRNPQFNGEALRAALAEAGIRYRWAGRHLGGLRGPAADGAHGALPGALRGYAEHMLGADFRRAAAQLCELAETRPTAVMCAERDPAHCHRSLLADYLLWRGREVAHLIEPGHRVAHRLHPQARVGDAGLVYDRDTQAGFSFATQPGAR